MQVKTVRTYTLVLSDEEILMLEAAIGATSTNSRIDSGMSLKHAQFMGEFYSVISDAISSGQ